MLGKAAYEILSNHYNVTATDIDLNEDWLFPLDVRVISDWEWMFSKHPFKKIFHLAALTDLEYCESSPDDAWRTNALGTENAALMAKKYGCDLIYVSTAGIFTGDGVFNDFDDPTPESIYGRSKYYGERIATTVPVHYVFRAGWMMGGGYKDKKFVSKICKQIESGADTIYAVTDKLGTPTYTYDFIENIVRVIQSGYTGVYNQVCSGDCSRYDVAVAIVEILGKDIKVVPVESDHFQEYTAPRPYSERLTNLKLDSYDMNGMRHWRVCLAEYLRDYYKSIIDKS